MNFIKKNYDILIISTLIIIVIALIISEKEVSQKYLDTTIIGDSRMVGLCQNKWYEGTCIAKVAIGYNWLVKDAINEVDKLDEEKKQNIVVNLGVNDLYNVNNYIEKYKELATSKWSNYNIFILSINPTKGSYNKLNKEIDEFNNSLKNSLEKYSNIYYCDSNSYLKNHGFESSDGLHYSSKTSKTIYGEIKKCISNYYN